MVVLGDRLLMMQLTDGSLSKIFNRVKNMSRIAIVIPTLNESDCIKKTVEKIDKGFCKHFSGHECFIVNADNNSQDGTKEVFLDTQTENKKIYLKTSLNHKGKGSNLINFWRFVQKEGIDFAATIDADIATLEIDWPYKLLDPVISGRVDYVLPLYTRSRFEGSTTNHFAAPLIYAKYGRFVRQPIGGEFGFNRRLVDYWLSREITKSDEEYGIDIFMTIHALGGDFKFEEVFLGRKLHKPSFPKIVPMFKEVCSSALHVSEGYEDMTSKSAFMPISTNCCIEGLTSFPHRDKALQLRTEQENWIRSHWEEYRKIFDSQSFSSGLQRILKGERFNEDSWGSFLAYFLILSHKNPDDMHKFVDLIAPVFILRAVDFWMEAEDLSPIEVESKIIRQAELVSEYIWRS